MDSIEEFRHLRKRVSPRKSCSHKLEHPSEAHLDLLMSLIKGRCHRPTCLWGLGSSCAAVLLTLKISGRDDSGLRERAVRCLGGHAGDAAWPGAPEGHRRRASTSMSTSAACEACRRGELHASSVDAMECHGEGLALNDAIEAEASGEALLFA